MCEAPSMLDAPAALVYPRRLAVGTLPHGQGADLDREACISARRAMRDGHFQWHAGY